MDYLWEEVPGVKMDLEMFMTKHILVLDPNKI
jgi:hypothetical protein